MLTRNVDFPAVYDIPNWKNVSPRLGVSYDLFGKGKTAVKASIGKYLQADNLTTITGRANPTAAIVTTATRTWSDANGDFIPQPNELGALSNATFGNSVINSVYDPVVLSNRGFNWEASASVQHERSHACRSMSDISAVGGNFIVTDNILVTPADYSTYCIKAPADSRLPGGGGYPVAGFTTSRRRSSASRATS